jgi:hypothetical protein
MTFKKLIKLVTLFSVLTVFSGCGGGGGGGGDSDTSGSLSVSSSVSGSQIIATAKYVNSAVSNPSGLKIEFTTDQPGLVQSKTVAVDSTGTAVALLSITGVPSSSTVNVIAKTGNLNASSSVAMTLPGLSLTLNTATLSLGAPLIATATYTNPHATSLKGVTIVFSADKSEIFETTTAQTDDTGKAVAIMKPKNTITAQTNVIIYAKRETQTQYANVTVKPEGLTLSAPADASHDIEATSDGVVEFIPSGVESFAVLTSGDGLPLANKQVTIGVQTIIGSSQTNVVFWKDYPATPYMGDSVTIMTDSTGKCPLQASVLVPFSGEVPGGKHSEIITVVWKVTYESPSGTVVGYDSTMYTVNVSGPAAAAP